MPRDRTQDYLLGVADLNVYVTLGPEAGDPQARERRHITKTTLRELVPCPGGCRGGGFELARDVHDRAVSRGRTELDGHLRCRGYVDQANGRRVACGHTLLYRAAIRYDARYY